MFSQESVILSTIGDLIINPLQGSRPGGSPPPPQGARPGGNQPETDPPGGRPGPGDRPPRRQTRRQLPLREGRREYGQCTVSTHPTGMHSCFTSEIN